MTRFLISDVVVGLEVIGENSIENIKILIGPSNPLGAKEQSPNSIRALFGQDSVKNAVECSLDETAYKRECDLFFGEKAENCFRAILNNCTLCLIKPHVVN